MTYLLVATGNSYSLIPATPRTLLATIVRAGADPPVWLGPPARSHGTARLMSGGMGSLGWGGGALPNKESVFENQRWV